ncbi:MAG: DNA-binding protein [Proteobacteria bacterium]|nr:MAG: DNA-binding protein [Pseudomonadota bacterium]
MNVICLQDDAFYALIDEVVARIREKDGGKQFKWIPPEEAMRMLNITSKTTLQKLRDEGKIRFSQPEKKITLYDRESIDLYLEKHTRNTF